MDLCCEMLLCFLIHSCILHLSATVYADRNKNLNLKLCSSNTLEQKYLSYLLVFQLFFSM